MWSDVYSMSVPQGSEVCSTAVSPVSSGTQQNNSVNARLPSQQGCCCCSASAGATSFTFYIHTAGTKQVLRSCATKYLRVYTTRATEATYSTHSWPAMRRRWRFAEMRVQAKFRQCCACQAPVSPPPPAIRPGDTGLSV